MKILIIPDSFKGSLTSAEVCSCIKNGLIAVCNAEIETLPFADGGEGFAQCLSNICNGEILYTKCHDIYGTLIRCPIYTYKNTAVIETASASGLQDGRDIMRTSSSGTGELIQFAYNNGFYNIILGLGGSGMCDGGAGALWALGTVFYDEKHQIMNRPCSGDMQRIRKIIPPNNVKDINFTYACDVTNPYFGVNGAAYVFAPQKGADKRQVKILDAGLKNLNCFLPQDVSDIAGSGAAGGLCGGLFAVFGGSVMSGFDVLSRAANLESRIKAADIIITGEGKTDSQTLMGKLPYRIALLAKKHNKKCIVISGSVEQVCFADETISLVENSMTTEYAIAHAKELLEEKSKRIFQ